MQKGDLMQGFWCFCTGTPLEPSKSSQNRPWMLSEPSFKTEHVENSILSNFFKSLGLLGKNNLRIYFSKMSKGFYLTTKELRSEKCLEPLMKWGTISNGKLLTANILFHRTENVCSLLDILEEKVEEKYYLSDSAMKNLQLNQK